MKSPERYPRTDLACEAAPEKDSHPGIVRNRKNIGGFELLTTEIINSEGERAVGKPIGEYHTLFTENIRRLGDNEKDSLISLLCDIVRSALSRALGTADINAEKCSFLVAGLGNRHLTADAVGPLTVEKITVTRELKYSSPELFESLGCSCVSALAPGVSAETGIEAADVIRGAVDAAHPDAVILIDALAARSCARLAATVQISDTGIYPGSGIGNRRTPITKETLGVPVITIGVPTIVDSSSLVYDALEEGGVDTNSLSSDLKEVLSNGRSFFVSPKDCDVITEDFSALIANAVNRLCGLF